MRFWSAKDFFGRAVTRQRPADAGCEDLPQHRGKMERGSQSDKVAGNEVPHHVHQNEGKEKQKHPYQQGAI